MKSYIENAYETGIFTLPLQILPISAQEFHQLLKNTKIIACGLSGLVPSFRTFQSVSNVLIFFENNKMIEFSSLVTMTNINEDEYASLKIVVHDNSIDDFKSDISVNIFNIDATEVISVEKLIYSNDEMKIDCGVIFNKNTNFEIKIIAEYGMELIVKAFFTTKVPVTFDLHRQLKCVPI